MKMLIILSITGLLAHSVAAQITPDNAVLAAFQSHPATRAASLGVLARQYAEKSARNLPNPELNVESPTGEFYAVGVLQSFEFPTVYTRQKQVAKAETALSQAGQRVTENDLRLAVRLLYLNAQAAAYLYQRAVERDSLYQAVAATAARQFSAGEIDFLQKTLAENEAGKIHQEKLAADYQSTALRRQLSALTGIADLGALLPLAPDTTSLMPAPAPEANPAVLYEQSAAQVAARQIKLAKSRVLPHFSLGYLNQGARRTSIDYRFRASVGIPLWAGQYQAGVKAATVEEQVALAQAEAQSQSVAIESIRIQSEVFTALSQVRYHEAEALPRSRSLIATAVRMREAGQVDYISFLRTLDEAYAIQRDYAWQVQALNAALYRLLHLAGR